MSIFRKLISFSSALVMAGTPNQISAQEQIRVDTKSNILISNSIEEKEIETVTASGFGTTLEAAFQNAAEIALTKVVGSFIDAETQIKKKTEIREGVLSKIKVIKKDVKDYSQGSIKYFEVLNVEQKDSIYIVTARVDVRIEDFRTYIKNLAFGSKKIDEGLFSSIKTDEDNIENKLDLIAKLTQPLLLTEVIDINIGTPERLENLSSFGCIYSKEGEKIINSSNNSFSSFKCGRTGSSPFYVKGFPAKGSIVIPVTFDLKKDYFENTINILDNISSHKKITIGEYQEIYDNSIYDRNKDYLLSLHSTKNKKFTQYVLSDAQTYHKRRKENNKKLIPIFTNFSDLCRSLPSLRVTLINKNKETVWANERSMCNLGRNFNVSEPDIKIGMRFLYLSHASQSIYPDLFIQDYYSTSLQIFDQAKMLLIIDPSNELINNIEEITLQYIQN